MARHKWKGDAEEAKTPPLPMTDPVLRFMAYGSVMEEYGRYSALAVNAAKRKAPREEITRFWMFAFSARKRADAKLRDLAVEFEGWPCDCSFVKVEY